MEPVEISAGRLHLRPFGAADVADLVRICGDPEIPRWTTLPTPYTDLDGVTWTTEVAPGMWESGSGAPFAVVDDRSGALLGSAGLHGIADGSAEVGYWCAADARGQGVTSDAVAAVCRWGFASLGLRHIGWVAGVGNWGSRRVAERNGFTFEGTLRRGMAQRGVLVDCWTGSRLAEDPEVDTRRLPPYVPLTDGVVTLRHWREDDAPQIVRGYDDLERARWLPGPTPYTLADAHSYLASVAAEPFDGTGLALAVVDPDDAVLGAVHLHLRQREHGIGEIGYWTAPAARGRGTASRATRLLSGWALAALGLNRVELLAATGNIASQRAAEKAGFLREGVRRAARPDPVTGRPRDMAVFALLGQDPSKVIVSGSGSGRAGGGTR